MASTMDSTQFAPFYNLAVIETQLGRLTDAQTDYKQALEIQPNNSQALTGLALLTAKTDKPEGRNRRRRSGASVESQVHRP